VFLSIRTHTSGEVKERVSNQAKEFGLYSIGTQSYRTIENRKAT
jgi:hypothetical protein